MTTPVTDTNYDLDWPFAHGGPVATAVLRASPEDFRVDEIPPCEPDGTGEHLLVHVRKREANTEWVARQLARFAGVPAGAVSYAGQKDRRAVTTQWFSIGLPGKPDPDFSSFQLEGVEILRTARHSRKLRRGALKGNRFSITLREVQGPRDELESRLVRIAEGGVPNYFGEQRFGHGGANLNRAAELFAGERRERDRHRRGMWLSAARSWLFNAVLADRVRDGSWQTPLQGEALLLTGSRSFFIADEIDDEIQRRLAEGDVVTSGPMWGRGKLPTRGEAGEREQRSLAPYGLLRDGLEHVGLSQERRALVLEVGALTWDWLDTQSIRLEFSLPAGSFATAVLRELVNGVVAE